MIAWIGTLANVAGAFAVALGYLMPGYSAFLLGSLAWTGIARKRKDTALFTLNAVFLCANIVGLYRNI
jgi:hypothetical protein